MSNITLPIFFAVDDAYLPFLHITISSMLKNTKHKNFNLHILNSGIKEQNKNIIKKFENENVKVYFDDVSEKLKDISEKLHTRDYYSKTTYYRLFIPKMYPQYEKALYLDSDIIVQGDIAKMFEKDLGDNLVGAVADEVAKQRFQIARYATEYLGLKDDAYFNAGVLMMDLKKLREFNFEEKFVSLISQIKFDVAQDQDYLNVLCKDRVFYFDGSWNQMPFPTNKYLEKDLNIIHYNLTLKPWKRSGVLFEEIFWKYAKESEFYNFISKYKDNYSKEKLHIDDLGEEQLWMRGLEKVNSKEKFCDLVASGVIKF